MLAAGIACQKTADQLIELYQENGKNIFLESVRGKRKWRLFSQLFGSHVLYPHEDGDQGLAQILKKELIHEKLNKSPTIGDIKHPYLLILAYDVLSRNTTWFANDDSSEWYYEIPLWEICTASASAPTFFPPYQLPYYRPEQILPHIDGGVAANNPTLAAIAHALSMTMADGKKNELKLEDIAVLSIGTGATTRPYTYSEIKKWGLLGWVKNLPNIFLNPGAENSAYIARRILQKVGSQNYLRLDFDLNKRFEGEHKKGELRKKLDKPYNEYIFEESKQYQEISEDIDDPTTCNALIKATQCYIKHGKVQWNVNGNNSNITVIEAIEKFIELH